MSSGYEPWTEVWLKEQWTEMVIVNSNVLGWKEIVSAKCCTDFVLHDTDIADLKSATNIKNVKYY